MKRIALLAAIGLSVLGSALPASANEGVSARGVLSSVSTNGVSIKAANHTINCAIGQRSPSLTGFSVGDRVQAQCRRVAKHLVLAKIRHFSAAADGVSAGEPVKFGGAVTDLSSTSITLHDGDRNLTCTIGDGSPSTTGLKVGMHAHVVCQNGALVSWAPVTSADAAHVYEGVVTAVTDGSISVRSGDHVFTCPLGVGSPSVAALHVGDRVLVGCRVDSNLLVLVKPLPPLPPAPPVTMTGGGTVTAVSPTSLTLHNVEHGDLTCSVGATSPSVAEVHVGDLVKIGCNEGVLVILVRVTTTTTPPPPAPVTLTAGGTLTALTTTSITVHNTEHGDVTCNLTDGSPALGDYQLGDHVGIACSGGVLKLIQKLT